MAYRFLLPGRTVIGENALAECEGIIKGFGKKALVVTGKTVGKTSAAKSLYGLLNKWGIEFYVFDGITGEPTVGMIDAGVLAYVNEGCDFLIGIGGGSPLDSVKAIAAMSVLNGKISDYIGVMIESDFPPMVLIPTTAGTGSEATKFTVITDTDNDVKMLLKGDSLMPDLAVIDPSFTQSSPRHVTAGTGIDALTHAVESYISKKANAITDIYAKDAVRRIFLHLKRAFFDGSDYTARKEMAIAAYEAGVCINNSSVTIVHGMSRPIGALFHVPHGFSNTLLLEECMRYIEDSCYEKFADLARVIGAAKPQTDDVEASGIFLYELGRLCGQLETPALSQFGVKKEDFLKKIDKMAEDALISGSPQNSPKELSKEDLILIYKKIWK